MSRLAIFVLWEKDGLVRDFILYYLKGLQEVAEKLIVVVNGKLSQEGRERLENIGAHVIQRENVGVDFWAYKVGLEYEGETVEKYEEVILANCSCYGPIYSFTEMFETMQEKKVDFWGITEWPKDEGGYKGTWVLSYFMVFRKNVFLSKPWKEYWKNLCPVYSRDECIDLHETKFTGYFADKGYTYQVYCKNTPDFIDMTIEAPDKLVMEQRCPIIKRKAFCAEYNRFLTYHRGSASKRVLEYIEQNKLYDTNMIIDDLLQTQHYDNVKNCLHLNYFLPSTYAVSPIKKQPKVALCFHVYYDELLESCVRYMTSMPHYADIYITTPKKELVEKIKALCEQYNLRNYKIDVISARGRAESAFLVATKKFIYKYDYVCIAHDKKSAFLKPGIIGLEFGFHNQDALLATKSYVENIIELMESNKRLGMLVPINLIYANYRELYGQEWGANYENVINLLKEYEIDVPIHYSIPPVAPMGAMFWFRPECLKKLIDKSWEYTDFPEEPLPLDGSLIHAIERAYPYFVQDAGYLTAWVSTIEDAEIHLTNISYLYRSSKIMLTEANKQLLDINKSSVNEPVNIYTVKEVNIGLKRSFKEYMKKHLPVPVVKFIKKCLKIMRK